MTTNVLIVDTFATAYRDELAPRFPAASFHVAATPADIEFPLQDVDVIISFGNDLPNEVFAAATRLSWFQSLATGVDQILRHPAFRPSTILTSARGIHAAPMRETVALLMLAVSRDVTRLVHDKDARRWDRGSPWPILAGKTAVVVGIGVSGIGVGQLLKAFGMHVIGISRTPREIEGFDEILPAHALLEVAPRADYLINVLPGGEANRNAISRPVIEALPPSSIFINVGRGESVDETALVDALAANRISGAGLDVTSKRPIPPDSPLWTLPNVFISPHIGGFFAEYEEHVMPIVASNMQAFIAGRPQDMVNVITR